MPYSSSEGIYVYLGGTEVVEVEKAGCGELGELKKTSGLEQSHLPEAKVV